MKKKRFKFSNRKIEVQWNEEQKAEPCEVMIYDVIGSDPWDGKGITAEQFKSVLDAAPKDRDLHVRVNSRGGDVHEGMTMMNLLSEWPNKVTATIDGIAASTASWMILAADEVRAHKASQIFIHDAISFGFGNAQDLRAAADDLDKTSNQIATFYAEKTGKGVRTMRDLMKNETLMTGEEAEEMGLVDSLIEGKPVRNFADHEVSGMKNRLAAFYNAVAKGGEGDTKNQKENMKKTLIAMLNKQGITTLNGVAISDKMTEEQLNAFTEDQLQAEYDKIITAKAKTSNADKNDSAVVDELKKLGERFETLNNLREQDRKARITNVVKKAIEEDRVPATQEEFWIDSAMANEEKALKALNSLQPKPPGSNPVSAMCDAVELAGDFKTVQNFILDNGPRFQEKFIGRNAGNIAVDKMVCKEMSVRSIAIANTIAKHRDKIISAWNANSIDSALQRQVILQDMLEAYAIQLINLNVFSTVYANVPLEGTDKVEVPYFPLQTNASTSFVKGTGYTTMQDWTQNSREISVGGDGASATSGTNAAANTARDRKFLGINFTSYDFARQPYMNAVKLFQQAANKLAVDIFTDIVSRVVTKASFSNSVKGVASASFSADDVADLRETATGLYWPQAGRNLVLNHTYYTPLLKDPSFKQYLAYGSSDPIQLGRIQNAYGFENIVEVAGLTAYSPAGENLVGWINHKSAVLVATANIMPAPAVRMLLEQFNVVTDPKTGISFAHRRFADATKDQVNEFIESSYGAGKGVDDALRRMTSSGT